MTDYTIETRSEEGGAAEETRAMESATVAVAELRTAIEGRLDEIETRIERANAIGGSRTAEEPTAEQRAFSNFVRHGQAAMTAEETRALGLATNGGAFLAPPQFIQEILKNLVNFSPVRQYARVINIGAKEAKLAKRTGTMTAAWVTEVANRPSTYVAYSEVTLTPWEASAYIDVSNQMLEDASYNLEGELAQDFAEEFGRLEGGAFVVGDGADKPQGFLNGTLLPETKSGQAATLGASDAAIADLLRTAFYALPAFYRSNSAWGMNSTTMALVSKLKDGQGRYHWQDGLVAGQPPTLLGRPVVEMPDMPDVAANAAPIVLADFNQMYRIADRVELSILRDPFSRATNGQTRFHGRRRVGGGVMKGEAGRKIVCKV
jgi:HK97 family phage major capsid protein